MERNESAATTNGIACAKRLNKAGSINCRSENRLLGPQVACYQVLLSPKLSSPTVNGDAKTEFTVQRAAANSVEFQLNSTFTLDD